LHKKEFDMGTRSFIGVVHGDLCKVVYCHWDGYLEHNGKILFENYNSPKAKNLVSLGKLSSLGPNIAMCTFYGRDRGEKDTEFKSYTSFPALVDAFKGSWCEYCYIMKDGVWYVFNSGNTSLRPLAEELAKLDAVA